MIAELYGSKTRHAVDVVHEGFPFAQRFELTERAPQRRHRLVVGDGALLVRVERQRGEGQDGGQGDGRDRDGGDGTTPTEGDELGDGPENDDIDEDRQRPEPADVMRREEEPDGDEGEACRGGKNGTGRDPARRRRAAAA